MKSAGASLIAYLNSNQQFYMADLYTISMVGGGVAYYTSHDANLTVGGHVFVGDGPLFTRSKTRVVIGVEVDTLDINITAQAAHLIGGVPMLTALRNGMLDGASIQLERLFMPSWGDVSLGTIIMFKGRVADIEVGRTDALIHVQSDLEILNVQMPRNLYQPGCLNTLYDNPCSLNRASYAEFSSVTAGSTRTVLKCSLVNAAGHFNLGALYFTSGVNDGVGRSVKSYVPGEITLMTPLVAAAANGDTFTVYAGCDKKQSTCQTKFNNRANFRGFPYVPAPESIN